jgi:DNA-directed RNA polymerase specialized sigma24 family protein
MRKMQREAVTDSTPKTVPPDALLVERIAALSDKTALAELDARHGMRLYAVAYARLFDPGAADAAVAAVFREVWRWAASFSGLERSVGGWLVELTRRAAAVTVEARTRGPVA